MKKRIALASVVAVAAGLISAIPAQAAASDTLSFSSLTPVRAGSGQNATLTIAAPSTNSVTGINLANVKLDVISAPSSTATLTIGTSTRNVTDTTTAISGAATLAAGNTATFSVQANTAGTYSYALFEDVNSNGNIDATEPFFVSSFTTTGAPASIAVTAPATTPTATNGAFTLVARDAAGNATQLGVSEFVTWSAPAATTGFTSGTLTAADFATGSATANVQNANAGTIAVTFTPSGLLTGLAAVSSTLTTAAFVTSSATALDVTSTTGVGGTLASGSYGSVLTGASSPVAVNASTATGRAITFRVTSSASGNVLVTVAKNGSAAVPAGITEGTQTVAVTTAGSVANTFVGSFTLTATAPITGSTYRVTVNNLSYNVTYDAPIVNSTKGTIRLNPAGSASARTLIGGTATVAATVADAFGDAAAGVNVVFSVSGRNTYTASATTNASGVASYAIVDASTSTSSLTDTINASAQSLTASNAVAATPSSLAYVTSVSAASLALTNNAATASPFTLVDATVTLTATARNSAGAGVAGIPVVFTLPAGAYVATAGTSTTGYTNTSGVATLDIKGTRVGVNSASAAAGGQSATSTFTLANTAGAPTASPVTNGDARVIAITAGTPATFTAGGSTKVTATVTGRYGNPVSGVTVSVSYAGTAGRVAAVNGVIGATGVTDSTGQIVVDLAASASEAGTGTLTVAFTGGDASTAALMGNGTAYTTRVASATAAVTVNKAVDTAGDTKTAVTAVQAQVTALATSVAQLVASLSAQIKALSTQLAALAKTVAKIRR